jgi:hypothetical protein
MARSHYWGTLLGGVVNSGVGGQESLSEPQSYLQVKAVHLGADARPKEN